MTTKIRSKTTTKKRSHQLTGVSGEYYVAAELSRLGYVASITLRNRDQCMASQLNKCAAAGVVRMINDLSVGWLE